jgi:hypothetical protein
MATAGKLSVEELGETNPFEWKKLVTATRCSRCSGLMVLEPCFDFFAWRCVQCGDMIDPVILQNRQRLAMN